MPDVFVWIQPNGCRVEHPALLLEEDEKQFLVKWTATKKQEWLYKDENTVIKDADRGGRRRRGGGVATTTSTSTNPAGKKTVNKATKGKTAVNKKDKETSTNSTKEETAKESTTTKPTKEESQPAPRQKRGRAPAKLTATPTAKAKKRSKISEEKVEEDDGSKRRKQSQSTAAETTGNAKTPPESEAKRVTRTSPRHVDKNKTEEKASAKKRKAAQPAQTKKKKTPRGSSTPTRKAAAKTTEPHPHPLPVSPFKGSKVIVEETIEIPIVPVRASTEKGAPATQIVPEKANSEKKKAPGQVETQSTSTSAMKAKGTENSAEKKSAGAVDIVVAAKSAKKTTSAEESNTKLSQNEDGSQKETRETNELDATSEEEEAAAAEQNDASPNISEQRRRRRQRRRESQRGEDANNSLPAIPEHNVAADGDHQDEFAFHEEGRSTRRGVEVVVNPEEIEDVFLEDHEDDETSTTSSTSSSLRAVHRLPLGDSIDVGDVVEKKFRGHGYVPGKILKITRNRTTGRHRFRVQFTMVLDETQIRECYQYQETSSESGSGQSTGSSNEISEGSSSS